MEKMMREYPWHLRLPTTEHYQRFKNLVQLHELTTGWLQEIQSDKPSYGLSRGYSKEVSENLWMLDSLSNIELDALLDDTSPSDTLNRLEHTIWAVQSWTVSSLNSRSNAPSQKSLESVLEQISWKQGKECCESRWKTLVESGPLDPREILLALNDSPFSGYPHSNGFLIKRAISTEVQIELRTCPHQIQFQETRPVADRLCRFHAQWMRGFAYALNSQLSVEHVVKTPRCTQRWFYPVNE
jgi:hypothetical protein